MKRVIYALVICLAIGECKGFLFSRKKIEPPPSDPDALHNVSQLISCKGYPVEEHYVQTDDGFILLIVRIPHGKDDDYYEGRPVIFLQHGFVCSAADWVINFPHQSLGFLLADRGYDVWMGNTRGNRYSNRHAKYKRDQCEFWDFSFDELAKYDLPTMLNHALDKTGQEQLYYIGHSQGTTALFALLSESPEFNEKIKLFIGLAPVTFLEHMTSAVALLSPFVGELDLLYHAFGAKELLQDSVGSKILKKMMCDYTKVGQDVCEDIMFAFVGRDKRQLNETRWCVYTAHAPAGSSVRSMIHFLQLTHSKTFDKFDYGKLRNMEMYNQETPPEYDLSRITTPVALVWSLNDVLADPEDLKKLEGSLRSAISSYCVPKPEFNHMDFLMAIDAPKLVNDHVFSLLDKY